MKIFKKRKDFVIMKTIVFNIFGKKLYLEHLMYEEYDFPTIFICGDDNNNYYVSYRIINDRDEEDNFIISNVSKSDIIKFLKGKITLLDIIFYNNIGTDKFCYEVIGCNSDVENISDICTEKSYLSLDKSILPSENSYHTISSKADDSFLEKLENECI